MRQPFHWIFCFCLASFVSILAIAQDGQNSAGEVDDELMKKPESAQTEESASPQSPDTPVIQQKMKKGTYAVRLRDLEDRINRLKEQIFRSKARLSLLAETVLDRKIAGAKASIVFRNEMGGSFRLV